MKNLKIFLLLILVCACQEHKEEKKVNVQAPVGNIPLDKELVDKIVAYQNKNPGYDTQKKGNSLKKNDLSSKKIYEVTFFKEKKDTLVSIILRMEGTTNYYDRITKNVPIYGIYKTANFQPTYILDPHKLGKNFVKSYIEDSTQLKKYEMTNTDINDLFFDLYVYKVKNQKLVLDTIDRGSVNYLKK